MTTFAQALREHPAPQRLGDVRLTFDQRILMGEAPAVGGRGYATGVGIGAVAFALCSAALLLTTQAATWLAGALAVDSAICAWIARRLELRSRHRRRFVAHHSAEQLRIERPIARGWRLDARWIPFDAVEEVEVRTAPTGARLVVRWMDARGVEVEATLIDAVPKEELEALYRFRRTLAGAFGVTTA